MAGHKLLSPAKVFYAKRHHLPIPLAGCIYTRKPNHPFRYVSPAHAHEPANTHKFTNAQPTQSAKTTQQQKGNPYRTSKNITIALQKTQQEKAYGYILHANSMDRNVENYNTFIHGVAKIKDTEKRWKPAKVMDVYNDVCTFMSEYLDGE